MALTKQLRHREGQFHRGRGRTFVSENFRDTVSGNVGLVKRLAKESILESHTMSVFSVDWNKDGSLLLSGGSDCLMKVWDIANGRRLLDSIDSGHSGSIFCTKFLPGHNDIVLSCGADNQIRLTHLEQPGSSKVYSCHQSRVKDLACELYNSNVFLSASEDGTVRQFDLRHKTDAHHHNKILVDLRKQSRSSFRSSGVRISTFISSRTEICNVCIHPTRPYEFMIGGGDPIVRVYDRRMLMGVDDPKKQSCLRRLVPSTFNDSRNFQHYYVSGLTYNHDGSQILVSYVGENIYTFSSEAPDAGPTSSGQSTLKRQSSNNPSKPKKRTRNYSSSPSTSSTRPATPDSDVRSSAFAAARSAARFAQAVRSSTTNQRNTPPTDTPPLRTVGTNNNNIPNTGTDTSTTVPPNFPEVEQFVMDLGRDIRAIINQLHSSPNESPTHSNAEMTASPDPDTPPIDTDGMDTSLSETDNEIPDRSMDDVINHLQHAPFGVRLNILGISPGVSSRVGREESSDDENDHSWFNLRRNRSHQEEAETYQPNLDGIYQQCYSGHRNSGTAMGVNYFGPRSKYIVSGSDSGCIFVWDTSTSKVVTILTEADSEWVRCLEGHPTNSILASCGSDTSVKLWSPSDPFDRHIDGIIEELKESSVNPNVPLYIHVMQIEHGPHRENRNTSPSPNNNADNRGPPEDNDSASFRDCSIQ